VQNRAECAHLVLLVGCCMPWLGPGSPAAVWQRLVGRVRCRSTANPLRLPGAESSRLRLGIVGDASLEPAVHVVRTAATQRLRRGGSAVGTHLTGVARSRGSALPGPGPRPSRAGRSAPWRKPATPATGLRRTPRTSRCASGGLPVSPVHIPSPPTCCARYRSFRLGPRLRAVLPGRAAHARDSLRETGCLSV
jgi:hypothetical protein